MGGRGWVWLAYDHDDGSVFNYIGDAQNTFHMWNCTVLLAMDVYEHAYYLDFQTARARYIDAFIQAIDWDGREPSLRRGAAHEARLTPHSLPAPCPSPACSGGGVQTLPPQVYFS
jgi:superoxide dismutase